MDLIDTITVSTERLSDMTIPELADPTTGFAELVAYCADTPELVAEFNRLTGSRLGQSARRSGFERMIDDATGYCGESQEDMAKFTAFVYECVWLRLPDECFQKVEVASSVLSG